MTSLPIAACDSCASAACAQAGLQSLVDQYATRLSACFEELTFLRRLSRHIEYCVADRSLAHAAEAILPQLRELIGVEGLCLVGAVESTDGSVQAERPTSVVGVLPGASEFWSTFVGKLGTANRRAMVRNYRGELAQEGAAPLGALRSIVLAPIEKDGFVFGWLLGANKQPPEAGAQTPTNSLGHDEIGSMEASLLEAAALMLGSHAANHRLFQEKEALVVDVIHTLVGVIEAKDAYTCGHSDRVALVARRLGAELGLSPAECQDIFLSGLLHDIGKIGVADDILLKPGKLTAEEFEQIKKHPVTGARLLQGLRPLEKLIPGVLHHHEAVDGSGYPHGLVGDQIPLMARILAVADGFDAMTSNRPYRPGMPLAKAEAILRDGAGKQWDARVVAALFAVRDDIVAIGVHWQDHLDHLLNLRIQRPRQRSVLGAASLATGLNSWNSTDEAADCRMAPAVR